MRRLLPSLSLLTLLACSAKPEFIYEARPDASLETYRTMAFDPRKVAWVLEGQHPVRAENLQRLVREALETRGFRQVEPEAADIWVDVITMMPNQGEASRGPAPEQGEGGPGGAGGHGGGRGGGGRHGASGSGPIRHPMGLEGFDPSGELTFTVQILTRTNAQPLWTGTVHLPAQKKGEQPDRRVSMQGVVRQLLDPLPRSQGAAVH